MIENLDPFVILVGNVGFPIVAFWLMYRMANDTIKKNTEAIHELTIVVKDRTIRKK